MVGQDDAWLWWALLGGLLACLGLAWSLFLHRRGRPWAEGMASALAGASALWSLVSLFRLLA